MTCSFVLTRDIMTILNLNTKWRPFRSCPLFNIMCIRELLYLSWIQPLLVCVAWQTPLTFTIILNSILGSVCKCFKDNTRWNGKRIFR